MSPGASRAGIGGRNLLLIGCALVAVVALVVVAVGVLGGDESPAPSAAPSATKGSSQDSSASADTDSNESAPASSTDSSIMEPPATLITTTTPPTPITFPPFTTTLVAEGDLGLSVPISRPECDGQYVTLIGASVDPANYVSQIDTLLRRYPGSQYMKTELVCGSLRGQTDSGAQIYVAFFGPFRTTADACVARAYGPSDAYVKTLDNFTPNNAIVSC